MPPTQDQASLALARQIDQMCDNFESRWNAGQRPRVEDYVNPFPERVRDKLLLALLPVELELLARQGKVASETDCRGRFPGLESVVSQVFANRSTRAAGETSVSQDSVPAPSPVATVDAPVVPQNIGRFVVVRVLGEGAFGTVYLAHDPRLDREVAVKVPKLGAIGGSFDTDRFLREARTAASLRHTNICPVYEADVHEGRPFIVMAYVAGQPLEDVLKGSKKLLSEKQSALVARRIATAIQAAHDKGIVHRDLKPANVMLERERKDVVVMDFGLARDPRLNDARATQSGVIMGTPAYMSPEQARGEAKSVGPAADVYSLGVMLYEMLAGQRPFNGTVTEVLGQILHVEPQPPSKARPGVDPQLEAICLKAMAKDPAARFASMKEFAQALDGWLRNPQGSAVETARAADTKKDAQASAGGSAQQMAEVVAAVFAEEKEDPAAVAGEPFRKAGTPRRVLVGLVLLLAAGAAALGGIVFFAKTRSATVRIDVDVNLDDRTLSFLLDKKPITAEELRRPVELTLGEHELVVMRGEDVVQRFRFDVRGGDNPGIDFRDDPGPPQKNDVAKGDIPEAGFVSIYNGKDLTGWQSFTRPESFGVDPDGFLTAKGDTPAGAMHWLLTNKEYTDYILRLEFQFARPSPAVSNSGIAIRSGQDRPRARGARLEVQLRNDPRPPLRIGSVVYTANDAVEPPTPLGGLGTGTWHSLEIEVRWPRVKVSINGKLVNDADLSKIDRTLLANTEKWAEAELDRKKGHIGIQSWKNPVKFRNIRVKDLSQP